MRYKVGDLVRFKDSAFTNNCKTSPRMDYLSSDHIPYYRDNVGLVLDIERESFTEPEYESEVFDFLRDETWREENMEGLLVIKWLRKEAVLNEEDQFNSSLHVNLTKDYWFADDPRLEKFSQDEQKN